MPRRRQALMTSVPVRIANAAKRPEELPTCDQLLYGIRVGCENDRTSVSHATTGSTYPSPRRLCMLHGCRSLPLLFVIALLSASAPRVAAWPSDPRTPLRLCTQSGEQAVNAVVSDGSGGAFVAWHDGRSGGGSKHIYAQRVDALGAVLWAAEGTLVCNASSLQEKPVMLADGAGGVVIIWLDGRHGSHSVVYAQRLNGAGNAQWTTNGIRL